MYIFIGYDGTVMQHLEPPTILDVRMLGQSDGFFAILWVRDEKVYRIARGGTAWTEVPWAAMERDCDGMESEYHTL